VSAAVKLGVIFPQTEIGTDPIAIRDYAQAAESIGFDYLLAFDHVLGANAGSRLGWGGSYSHTDSFHEPFVLFGYLAAVTRTIGLTTGILILPQRQTTLVAKQAAEVDVLSGGRLRLGIGTGWNAMEYEGLGEDFSNRGLRSEEQIEVMRSLWTNDLVTLNNRWHKITDAGINPRPVQQPIPIWFGGSDDRVLRRVARIGDGWISNMSRADGRASDTISRIREYGIKEGRDLDDIGIETWVSASRGDPDDWANDVREWTGLGATHISINTMGAGLTSVEQHISAIRTFAEVVGKT
jgi:probable F420-dependent oxidoreductase